MSPAPCKNAMTPLFGDRAECELDFGHDGPHRIDARRLSWDEHVYWHDERAPSGLDAPGAQE